LGLDNTNPTSTLQFFSLALSGFYFPADSVVRWNNLDLTTHYVDEFHLTAGVPGNFLETTGTVQLTVFSPAYGNLEINSLPFEVVTLIQYPLFIPLVRR